MSESLELQSLSVRESQNEQDNDIQEYHEINPDANIEKLKTLTQKQHSKPINEFEFFTQLDIKTVHKKSSKKPKNKAKSSNLMDIISTELATSTVPIAENVMSIIKYNDKVQQDSFLERIPKQRRIFQKFNSFFVDFEHGRRYNSHSTILSPVFPRILENATVQGDTIAVEYVEPAFFTDVLANNVSNNHTQEGKFIDITVNNIKFKHHHKFTLEKLLCVKLADHYKEYKNIQRILKELLRDIKVNRETKNNLKQDLLEVNPNKRGDIRFDQTIRKYTGKMLQLKERYVETLRIHKKMVHEIISLWSDIQMVREKSKATKTPYMLQISKMVLSQNDYERVWNDIFDVEFTDALDKIEFDYVTKCIQYKEAKVHQNSVNSMKTLTKPKLKIDEEAVRYEVENIVNSIVVREEVDITLHEDVKMYTNLIHSDNDIVKNIYCFEFYVDDVFVCESEQYSTDDRIFDVNFSETFSVQILPKNNDLTIVLIENYEKVSYLKINLAEIKKSCDDEEFVKKQFIYNTIIEPDSEYVGSGFNIKAIAASNKVRLKSSNTFKGDLHTTCEVSIKMAWNSSLSQNGFEAIKSSMEIGRQLKRLLHGIDKPNTNALTDVIGKIYGKDINKDENMIDTLSQLCKSETRVDESFSIDENSPDFIRLKLLHLRNIGGFTNVENKMVPIHASQISTEQLNCLQNTNDKEFNVEYLNAKHTEMEPIEFHRFISAKFLQKLNRNMLVNLNQHLMEKTHKDVVRDFKDLSLRSLFSKQSNLATLANISSGTKQQILNESLSKEQEIQVTVLRAFNLLDRRSTILDDCEDDDRIAGFKVRPLRPFVRVGYRGVSAQTVTALGCHPTWNHALKINTKLDPISSLHINVYDEYKVNITETTSDDDQSHSKTMHYRYYNKWLGSLHIPLMSVLTLGSLRGTFKILSPPLLFGYETMQNKESSSLIPEISQLMKKDASFVTLCVTTSLSHLGGSQGYNQPIPSALEDDYIIKHLNNFVTDYVNDFPNRRISLTFIDSAGRNKCVTQFLQAIPLPNRDAFPKNPKSCGSAMSKSSGFSRSSSSNSGRKREVDVEASQEEKDSVYSSQEASWKNGDNHMSKILDACLRYVSLIPTYEVTESHVVTLMGLELLKILHGSPLDHTILLASYFLYLGIKCWVAIGLGLPRGLSSYVLIKYDLSTHRIVQSNDQLFKNRGFLNKTDSYMWYVCDAVTGDRHELRDVGCPLKTVDYVFDRDNIWVNVQASQDCESMSFDFSRSSDWQPVFDKTIFIMKQPIVTDTGLYSPPANVDTLRQTLETKIKGKVQKWRPHMKTIWNRYCSTLLREVLPHWEYRAFNSTDSKPGLTQKLRQMVVTYKMFGFPLNMSFVNTKSVISAVKATALHVNDDPHIEFALGVEVYAYPNNVISVWVFLASITRI